MEFKPGSYKKGDIVYSEGFCWIADRDIANAQALPKDNMYWSKTECPNTNFIQAQIDAVPEWGRKVIHLPDGDHYINETIKIHNRGIHLIGGADTRLLFPAGVTGISISRTHSAMGLVVIENLYLRGRDLRAGTIANGIECTSITAIKNCHISNFGGNGIEFSGEVANGHDTSRSIVWWSEVGECGNGFYTQGGDANGIAFYSCSARDCDGVGFFDNSFLGCSYYSCMTHACHGGGYKTGTHGNNRTLFMAPYSEGGQPASVVDGVTYIFGGISGSGLEQWDLRGPNSKIWHG